MKTGLVFAIAIIMSMLNLNAFAVERYGQRLCTADTQNFICYKVKRGNTWEKLFHDADTVDMMKRLNRTNLELRQGWVIAIPRNYQNLTYLDLSPFPLKATGTGQKTVLVDLNHLAWGAYDEQGNLIHWGPASGGQDWCDDINKPCRTHTGNYVVYNRQGYDCISSIFPIPTGGAAMPYCMHYYRGFALHGSFEVPGYNASHGCVRMFITDARWLNERFVNGNTKVIVKPY